ncbi:hypothetical protein CU044_2198 [Streptomyces sp. L-9-10]|nr:hypothetical protein CU044_2198 [Streptomyces sp. L-9-10]
MTLLGNGIWRVEVGADGAVLFAVSGARNSLRSSPHSAQFASQQ